MMICIRPCLHADFAAFGYILWGQPGRSTAQGNIIDSMKILMLDELSLKQLVYFEVFLHTSICCTSLFRCIFFCFKRLLVFFVLKECQTIVYNFFVHSNFPVLRLSAENI